MLTHMGSAGDIANHGRKGLELFDMSIDEEAAVLLRRSRWFAEIVIRVPGNMDDYRHVIGALHQAARGRTPQATCVEGELTIVCDLFSGNDEERAKVDHLAASVVAALGSSAFELALCKVGRFELPEALIDESYREHSYDDSRMM